MVHKKKYYNVYGLEELKRDIKDSHQMAGGVISD